MPEMQALSERLDLVLSGLELQDAQLLGFSSLKTYSPDSQLAARSSPRVGHPEGQVPGVGVRQRDADRAPPLAGGPTRRGAAAQGDEATWIGGALPVRRGNTRSRSGARGGTRARVRNPSQGLVVGAETRGRGPAGRPRARAREARRSPTGSARASSRRRLTTDLRDQHFVSGIGRGWGDDILHRARLSPFASLGSLSADQRSDLLTAVTDVLAGALERERQRKGGLSEAKLGARFAVHGRAGEPCPTPCGDTLRMVSFESYEMTYCPTCQTGGRVLADRRLSRLLK